MADQEKRETEDLFSRVNQDRVKNTAQAPESFSRVSVEVRASKSAPTSVNFSRVETVVTYSKRISFSVEDC